jgi:hypothetical protein
MCALRPPRPEPDYLNRVARGLQRRSRIIRRSTQLIAKTAGITGTVDITGIVNNNLQTRKRRGFSVALTTQRSGARSIKPQGMIWKNAKLF